MSAENITQTLKLNTGATIPQVGFGSFDNKGEEGYKTVLDALKAGYRHIDTAAAYRNEVEVGKAIRDSGIPREEIFVTTKFWQTQHRDPKKALEQSLQRLGLDYVDLLLVHWPVAHIPESDADYHVFEFKWEPVIDTDWDIVKTWGLVQELAEQHPEKVKAVGVSNFSVKHLKQLFEGDGFKITPAVNQIEIHPLLPNTELVEFCKKHGIVVEAYSPLGSGGILDPNPFFNNETLLSIAKERNVTVAQLLVNWGVKRGYAVLPKSSNCDRITSNLKDIQITDSEFERISDLVNIHGEKRTANLPWIDFANN